MFEVQLVATVSVLIYDANSGLIYDAKCEKSAALKLPKLL